MWAIREWRLGIGYFLISLSSLSPHLFILLLLLTFPTPAWAATPPERMTLTGKLLQKHLNAPIQEDGFSTIDPKIMGLKPLPLGSPVIYKISSK
ncbi:MAG: hypothetical protein BRC52_15210 [Cyanobacteria bacterium SW_5_48_44]|nr:MAG: hypothetical protein BRC52_15210 [Cyanobacteria bacterium SW_5_48_44]